MDAKQIAESFAAVLLSIDPFQLAGNGSARFYDARLTGRMAWERREKLQTFAAVVPGVMALGPVAG